MSTFTVTDPGFFGEGAPTPKVDVETFYFAIFLVEKCMKMKEFGPRRGGSSLEPPLICQFTSHECEPAA